MTDTLALEMAIKRMHYTKKEVAKMIGISENAFSLKINNKNQFKANEIDALTKLLKLPDRELFFRK